MRKILFLTLALFFGTRAVTFSQSFSIQASNLDWSAKDPSSGEFSDFILTKTGEKVFGEIIRGYNQTLYLEILFESNGSKQTYLPQDILGFGLSNGQIFHSRPLPNTEEMVFSQILVSGPIELSTFKESYYLDNGVKYEKLEAYYYKVTIMEREARRYFKGYIATLKSFLEGSCGVELYPTVESMPYNEKDMIGIMVSYFECLGSPYKVHVEKVPFLRFSPTIGLGMSHFSIKPTLQSPERRDQFVNNIGFQGMIGVRFHEFRRLPRFSLDLRLGYSSFETDLLAGLNGTQAKWTGSEKIKETAIYAPISFNYSVIKNQQKEIYVGLTGGIWKRKVSQSQGIVDERKLAAGEVILHEEPLASWTGGMFIPGIKVGSNFSITQNQRIFLELEGNSQYEYYRFDLLQNEAEYSRTRISILVGFEF